MKNRGERVARFARFLVFMDVVFAMVFCNSREGSGMGLKSVCCLIFVSDK